MNKLISLNIFVNGNYFSVNEKTFKYLHNFLLKKFINTVNIEQFFMICKNFKRISKKLIQNIYFM